MKGAEGECCKVKVLKGAEGSEGAELAEGAGGQDSALSELKEAPLAAFILVAVHLHEKADLEMGSSFFAF
ncbi:hypothetical protein HPP92_019988 [Vanilla planifolia]|uniref:Uncharacterized protein n=1 Tax=Vanilla planifolia TaxID=51239 RepID=A0A835QA21_VANPL|nr:hypothetical protein HPP92_019988 [Vanilla planifolia]